MTDNTDLMTPRLREAQAAINHPEVQEILKKLAKYNLGIFMPHMHDSDTGSFIDLPNDTVSVEEGLKVSFKKNKELEEDEKKYVDVAWQWINNGVESKMVCRRKCIMQGSQHTHDGGC